MSAFRPKRLPDRVKCGEADEPEPLRQPLKTTVSRY